MSNIRDELAEAINFAIRSKSYHLRKAKLTEAQCRIDSGVIADHVLLANFIVMHGAPSRGTHSTTSELQRAKLNGGIHSFRGTPWMRWSGPS